MPLRSPTATRSASSSPTTIRTATRSTARSRARTAIRNGKPTSAAPSRSGGSRTRARAGITNRRRAPGRRSDPRLAGLGDQLRTLVLRCVDLAADLPGLEQLRIEGPQELRQLVGVREGGVEPA